MHISLAGSRSDKSNKGMVATQWNGYTASAFGVRFFARTRTLRFCVIFDGKNLLVFLVDIATLVSKLACAVFRKEVTNSISGLRSVRAGLGLFLYNVCLIGSSVIAGRRSWRVRAASHRTPVGSRAAATTIGSRASASWRRSPGRSCS